MPTETNQNEAAEFNSWAAGVCGGTEIKPAMKEFPGPVHAMFPSVAHKGTKQSLFKNYFCNRNDLAVLLKVLSEREDWSPPPSYDGLVREINKRYEALVGPDIDDLTPAYSHQPELCRAIKAAVEGEGIESK